MATTPSYHTINGQQFEAGSVTQPPSGKKFRDAWDTPVNGVITINPTVKAQLLLNYVKEECRNRIYAVADETAQMNLAAAAATGLLSAEDLATFKSSLAWVAAMRANVATLVGADDEDYSDDAKWPAVPAGVAELGAKY